ncbi:MAG: 50S ribosomal protein L29 [bacterium]
MSLEKYLDWNNAQVKARYKELKKEFFDLRLKSGIGQLTDYSKIKKVKREIARLLTYAKKQGFMKVR